MTRTVQCLGTSSPRYRASSRLVVGGWGGGGREGGWKGGWGGGREGGGVEGRGGGREGEGGREGGGGREGEGGREGGGVEGRVRVEGRVG